VPDFDAAGIPVGIDIDNASKKLDLQTLSLSRSGEVQTTAAQLALSRHAHLSS
jgi:hypothetical protein